MMLTQIFLLCLVPILLAAPTTDTTSTVHNVQKRGINCNFAYGTKINPEDCRHALNDVPDTIVGQDMHFVYNGFSGLASMDGTFSNKASNPRYKLPKFFGTDRSCTLGVSLANVDSTVKFNWDAIKRELSKIVDTCIVADGGKGGSSNTYSNLFDIAIWAEPLNHDVPVADQGTGAQAFCGAKPTVRLFDCLRHCFTGGCGRVSGIDTIE
ncbi:MAG: hypothetical protein M1830_000467 [Pleopsidium flavum]|nr:MAG: hypothetical protein M1830_000467 [Pleopsidium flavum]